MSFTCLPQASSIEASRCRAFATSRSQITAPIAFNATAAQVQSAIEAQAGFSGKVTVGGGAGGPYTLTFDKSLGNLGVLVDSSGLTAQQRQTHAGAAAKSPSFSGKKRVASIAAMAGNIGRI